MHTQVNLRRLGSTSAGRPTKGHGAGPQCPPAAGYRLMEGTESEAFVDKCFPEHTRHARGASVLHCPLKALCNLGALLYYRVPIVFFFPRALSLENLAPTTDPLQRMAPTYKTDFCPAHVLTVQDRRLQDQLLAQVL